MDHNRCILCQRCVRVCGEVEWAATKGVMGRGINTRIIHDLNQSWGDSDTCTSCGKCVNICPTGALFEKGKSAGEMVKRRDWLPYLKLMHED
jgi:bidirectional [NiFe] hydrogenase diaphorase subunit